MLELTDKDTKIIIKTVFHMTKMLSKDKKYFFLKGDSPKPEIWGNQTGYENGHG